MDYRFQGKVFLALIISAAFIIIFGNFGVSTYQSVFEKETVYEKGTKVGPISIAGLTKSEAEGVVAAEVSSWRQNSYLEIVYQEHKLSIAPELFLFDVQKSIESVDHGKSNPLFVSIDQNQLTELTTTLSDHPYPKELDHQELQTDLLQYARQLPNGSKTFELLAYTKDMDNSEVNIVAESIIKGLEGKHTDLASIVKKISPITIEANTTFSFVTSMREKGISLDDLDKLNILASSVYKTILRTNFKIHERHISKELPNYIDIGFEAKIVPNEMDLVIENVNKSSYLLSFELIGNTLYSALKGLPFDYSYQVNLEEQQSFDPKTVIQYTALLQPGEIKIEEKGKSGSYVKVYRDVYQKNDRVDRILISEDFYAPIHRIELRSLQTKDGSNIQVAPNADEGANPSPSPIDKNPQATEPEDDILWGEPDEPLK